MSAQQVCQMPVLDEVGEFTGRKANVEIDALEDAIRVRLPVGDDSIDLVVEVLEGNRLRAFIHHRYDLDASAVITWGRSKTVIEAERLFPNSFDPIEIEHE